MNAVGFDNQKYLMTQSEQIRKRIAQFGGKLYLEFGGKLFDDFHAARVLPGFAPDSKIRMLLQHPNFAVRRKTGQHAGCMIVVKQLAAKLQIQLAAELGNAVLDVLRLHL